MQISYMHVELCGCHQHPISSLVNLTKPIWTGDLCLSIRSTDALSSIVVVSDNLFMRALEIYNL